MPVALRVRNFAARARSGSGHPTPSALATAGPNDGDQASTCVHRRSDAIDRRPTPIHRRSDAGDRRPRAIHRRSEATDRRPTPVHRRSDAIDRRPTRVHLRSTPVHRPSTAVHRPSTAVHRPSVRVRRSASARGRMPEPDSRSCGEIVYSQSNGHGALLGVQAPCAQHCPNAARTRSGFGCPAPGTGAKMERSPASDDGARRHVHFALVDGELDGLGFGPVIGRTGRLHPRHDLLGT